MPKEKILITVKTYPTLSSKYDEVVCTAGLREDGSWIRIYPIPFRQLDDYEKYRKYDWIEADLERNTADPRHESFRLKSEITVLNHVDTGKDRQWRERRDLIIGKGIVYTNFAEIIDKNKDNHSLSLATFKPTEICGFTVEEEKQREWDQDKVRSIEGRAKQTDLFKETPKYFRLVNKIPYKFRYAFKDYTGKRREIMIEDWETGMLYWNELKRHNGDEKKAIEGVRYKYLHQLIDKKDIHFFVGTTREWDARNAPNPFIIVGVFSPPEIVQDELF